MALQARNMLRAGEFGAGPFTLSMEAIREFEVSADRLRRHAGPPGRRLDSRGHEARAPTQWTGSVFAYYRGSDLSAATDFQGKSRAQPRVHRGAVGRQHRRAASRATRRTSSSRSTGRTRPSRCSRATSSRRLTKWRPASRRIRSTAPIDILGRAIRLDTRDPAGGPARPAPDANTIFARLDWALSSTEPAYDLRTT